MSFGFLVGANRFIGCPSLPIKNLVKLHSKTNCKDDVAVASSTGHITQFGLNSPDALNTR